MTVLFKQIERGDSAKAPGGWMNMYKGTKMEVILAYLRSFKKPSAGGAVRRPGWRKEKIGDEIESCRDL